MEERSEVRGEREKADTSDQQTGIPKEVLRSVAGHYSHWDAKIFPTP